MFKDIRIRNFKGIDELWLDFSKLNVLIGANSAGKSTIIQAIDLLINSVSRDIPEYLSERGWKVDEIKSQISRSRIVSFYSRLCIEVQGKPKEFLWRIEFIITQKDNSIYLHEEDLSMVPDAFQGQSLEQLLLSREVDPVRDSLFSYKNGELIITNEGTIRALSKLPIQLSSSILKVVRKLHDADKLEYIKAITEFINNSLSFETLSVDKMRHSSRGATPNIGRRGERLAAYIKQFDNDQKERFYANLRRYIPHLSSLDTITKGKPGWIELFLNEAYNGNDLKIKSSHISDGSLRIVALVSLLEVLTPMGLTIFDEIEDGINPHIASDIVKLLYDYTKNSRRQLLITTHSSLMLDDFDPSNIIYVFRSAKGAIKASKVFEREDVKAMLEFMNPGEVWINTTEKDLIGNGGDE
jgi:predicted ATPase